jgi:CheY-like chemotaxis protein
MSGCEILCLISYDRHATGLRQCREATGFGLPPRRIEVQLESRRTILVADDEELMRTLIAATLSSGEFVVLEAETGDVALDLVRSEHPDLVLLDQRMPGLDGVAVCQAIKADPALANVRVVMVTAHPEDEARARTAGADGFLTKPYSPLQLLETIDALLPGDLPRGS